MVLNIFDFDHENHTFASFEKEKFKISFVSTVVHEIAVMDEIAYPPTKPTLEKICL
jgi:hypothetical protein